MHQSFGDYLKTQRSHQQLGQEQLAVALEQFDSHFSKLTNVTICNWENNTQIPTIHKIRLLAEYFGHDPVQVISHLTFNHTAKRNVVVNKLHAKIDFAPKGKQIGCFPITDGYQITDLNLHADTALMELIIDYDHSIYSTDNPVTTAILKQWSGTPENICYACTYKDHYFGHLIALRLDCNVFATLLSGSKAEAAIATTDFARNDQPHCLYVYSIYAANKSLAAILMLQLLQQILRSQGNCKQIGGLCSTADGMALADAMGLKRQQIVAANGNIKYGGQTVACATFGGKVMDVFQCIGTDMLAAAVQFNIERQNI